MRKILKRMLVLSIILVGLFYFTKTKATQNNIVINEIAWMGTEYSANDEWLEFWNMTDSDIDLENWKLISDDGTPEIDLSGVVEAGGYFLLERTDDESVPGVVADLIYTGALGNTGENLKLINNESEVVDSVLMSDGWLAGDNDLKLTMARVGDNWQSSLDGGGTPGALNSESKIVDDDTSTTTDSQLDDNPEGEADEGVEVSDEDRNINTRKYKIGDVLISEFVSDPEDEEEEWVEIYNNTKELINLSGWFIEEGSGAKTMLEGKVEHFFVIEKLKGNLNNNGDVIMLKDFEGRVIDKVVYGDWDDGNLEGNAKASDDPNSVARKYSTQNTFNSANDFSITSEKTKGKENIIVNIEGEDQDDLNYNDYDYNDEIIISEIYANPVGEDSKKEFIELYNFSEVDINLYRWRIGDNSKKELVFKEEKILKAGKFLLLYRSETSLALNNNGDAVKLFQPLQEASLVKVEYKNAEAGMSYSYNEDVDKFEWTKIISPGFKNVIKTINYEPEVDFEAPEETKVGESFIFDASDVSDINGDELSYLWNFGDGVVSELISLQHTYWESGEFIISLTVSDGEFEIEEEKKIVVNSVLDSFVVGEALIEINRFEANPEGSDLEGEWIELINNGETKVNLRNWKIDDREGGSNPYEILENIWLDPGDFFIIDREDSKIALNNTLDEVRLFDVDEVIVDSTKYEKAKEGFVFYKNEDGWVFETNDELEKEITVISGDLSAGGDEKGISVHENNTIENDDFLILNIEDLDNISPGFKVAVQGVVTTLPGLMGSQYFYIYNEAGVQIYNFKKDFSDNLELGDVVLVKGELSKVKDGNRIKIKNKESIKIVSKAQEALPVVSDLDILGECNFGSLVRVVGEVVEVKGLSVFLSSDSGEVEVYLKKNSGIRKSNFNEGEKLEAVGVLIGNDNGVRVYPRKVDDIVLIDGVDDSSDGEVLGEVVVKDNWELAQRDKHGEYWKSLAILLGFVSVCLVLGLKFYKGRV